MLVKPHVSPALVQLRRGVTAAALAVILCAAVQLVVFGFVHFTSVRWVEPAVPTAQAPTIVQASAGATLPPRPVTVEHAAKPLFPGRWDHVLSQFSTAASGLGTLAALVLIMQLFAGLAVAAGGAVPGVDRVARSLVWGSLAIVGCLPLSEFMPSLPLVGVFGSYARMTGASEAVNAGLASGSSLIAFYVAMPAAAITVLTLAAHQFHSGVAAGTIVTSVNDLDRKLEEEMVRVREAGPGVIVGARTVGALNRALGEAPERPEPIAFPADPALNEVVDRSRARDSTRRAGEPLRRPI